MFGCVFLILSCLEACQILVPWPGIEPLRWKHGVLTTELHRKFLDLSCWAYEHQPQSLGGEEHRGRREWGYWSQVFFAQLHKLVGPSGCKHFSSALHNGILKLNNHVAYARTWVSLTIHLGQQGPSLPWSLTCPSQSQADHSPLGRAMRFLGVPLPREAQAQGRVREESSGKLFSAWSFQKARIRIKNLKDGQH